jgi:dihydrofolate reductase
MTSITFHVSISLDGFLAGPDQSRENPLGIGGPAVHQWHFEPVDHPADIAARDELLGPQGAYIMGRNMFGPIRGEWPDEQWKGWWGNNPPYHAPTFVLTHYPRASIEMDGGTTFHFITDGIEAALHAARKTAGQKDIKIGGGVETVRQYIRAGHVDEIHLAVAPVVLGQGEALFDGIDLRSLGYRTAEHVPTERATHVVLAR